MRSNTRKSIVGIVLLSLFAASCEQYFEPTTAIDETSALSNASDVATVTIGNYAFLKNANYTTSGHILMEYPSDEIAQGQISSNDLTRAYRYTHINTSAHATNYWAECYKTIAAANKVIGFVPDDASAELRQLKGENIFLRAMIHFNLVRIFGRPYNQNNASNPGIPILTDLLSESEVDNIKRSTVKEVYDSVITDLLRAAELMSERKPGIYASKEVAYALLSKVYLFKEDNENALKYANLVISSGRYSLIPSANLPNYFRSTPENNAETIFAVRHTNVQIAGISTMYISSDVSLNPKAQGVSGWAELYASRKFFLRAMIHFNLVRIFGRPYNQNNASNPGIPILTDLLSESEVDNIKRSTVKEVYDSVITDLLRAAELMSERKPGIYASKEVAYALLSKVYLFKEDNENALKYANLVISSGRYSLIPSANLPNYFRSTPENNAETIFAVRHTNVQIAGISTMYISSDVSLNPKAQGVSGWAELYASRKYWDFIRQHPEDLRLSFITPYQINGVLQYNGKLDPPTPMYYINKFTLQEGVINAASPVYLRLADIYLIRAEANAKMGNAEAALQDVNLIRSRAGLSGNALYSTGSVSAAGKTILDVVLEERFLELAFEGHRVYDLFRNGRPMERNYPGTHSQNNTPTTNVYQKVEPTDPRVVFYIPQAEIDRNSNLTQNP